MHKIIAELTKSPVAEIAAAAFAGGVIVGVGAARMYQKRQGKKFLDEMDAEFGHCKNSADPNQMAFNLMDGYRSGPHAPDLEFQALLDKEDQIEREAAERARQYHPSVKTDYTNPGPLVVDEEVYNNPPEVDDIQQADHYYLITSEEFYATLSERKQDCYTWFVGDGVLVDDTESVVHQANDIVGIINAQDLVNRGPNDGIYIRDTHDGRDIEIEVSPDRFADDSYDDEMFERITKPPQLEE